MSKIQDITMGLMIGSVIILVFSGAISELSSNYGYPADSSYAGFNKTFNKIGEIRNITDNITASLQNAEITDTSGFYIASVASLKSFKLGFKAINIVSTAMTELMNLKIPGGLPGWLFSLVVISISLTLALLILGALLRART